MHLWRLLAAIGLLLCLLWLVAGPPHPQHDLTRGMEAALRADPRFAAVSVVAFTNGQLVIYAPEVLPASAKADLERVASLAPRRTVVSYTTALSSPP